MNDTMQKTKKGISSWVFVLYGVYYISGYSSSFHNYIIVGLFLAWNFVAFAEDRKSYEYAISSKCSLFLLLFVLYYFIPSIVIGDFIYTLEYVIIYMCLYGTCIQYRYYRHRARIREIKFILICLLAALFAFSISAIVFYALNPSAARVLAADYYAYNAIAIGGGYAIAIGVSILAIYFIEIQIRKKSFVGKELFPKQIWMIICIVVFEYLLIKTESTTTLIANIFGIIVCIIAYRKWKSGRSIDGTIILGIVLILGLILFAVYINEIGRVIVDITSQGVDNVILRRFNRIGQKMMYAGNSSGYTNYVDERIGTIRISWNTFLENPIFGVGYKCGNVYSSLRAVGVGLHSEIFDVLAQFGIIGFIFWSGFVIKGLKYLDEFTNCKSWKATLLILLAFNPFRTFHGYVVIFFVIPMIEYILSRQQERL